MTDSTTPVPAWRPWNQSSIRGRVGSPAAMAEQQPPPDDVPTGLPPDEPEEGPLGVPDARPEGDDEPDRGPGAMPGIPTEGDPPDAG